MDIKSIGMRVSAWWREKADVMLDIGRLAAVAVLFSGSGILYAQHFLFPAQSFTIRQAMRDPGPAPAAAVGVVAPPGAPVVPASAQKSGASYVASKNGTKYYRITCKNRISKENMIYFQGEEDAKKAGYAPSATCFK